MAAFYLDRLVEGTLDWTTATLAKWGEIFFEEFTFYLTINYLKVKLFQVATFTVIVALFFIGRIQAGQQTRLQFFVHAET